MASASGGRLVGDRQGPPGYAVGSPAAKDVFARSDAERCSGRILGGGRGFLVRQQGPVRLDPLQRQRDVDVVLTMLGN